MKPKKTILIVSQSKVYNMGKQVFVELGRFVFENEKITGANALQSQAMRDMWSVIRSIAEKNELQVDIEHILEEEQTPEEKKKALSYARRAAIIQFKAFYSSYGFGDYVPTAKDTQITLKQARLVLDESQLRKYFETTHWKLKDKFLSVYCSAETQNILNQKQVEAAIQVPDTWQLDYYNRLSESNRVAYIKHLKSLGFEKKAVESGVLTYVNLKKP
jgi:hypothetical protein